MESIEFVIKYLEYQEDDKEGDQRRISPVITKMESWDPHNLIQPDC